uniref:Uncharacterized protein n=1 Tax=Leersia perrieri TaxID=77586 RepID=A0A0D9WK24_9ORYZ
MTRSVFNPGKQQERFYLAVIHAPSGTPVSDNALVDAAAANNVRAFKDTNAAVASMSVNAWGLFAVVVDGALVFRVGLLPAEFCAVKLGSDDRLHVTSFALVNSSTLIGHDFVFPVGDYDLPLQCPSLGLCTAAGNTARPALLIKSNREEWCAWRKVRRGSCVVRASVWLTATSSKSCGTWRIDRHGG